MAFEMLVIGASLGGCNALQEILSGLPADFPLPIVLVQHRSKQETQQLPRMLQRRCKLPLLEIEDKLPVFPSKVYLAPADYHVLIENGEFALSVEPPRNFSRPSINTLFESAAEAYAERLIAVVLTGTNSDGADGVSEVERRGGLVIVQDPESAEGKDMPLAAISATQKPMVMPLATIAAFLGEICKSEAA
jgi:two-component system, chemotaxis family, protein-glutamate methylesterase/glutaminase